MLRQILIAGAVALAACGQQQPPAEPSPSPAAAAAQVGQPARLPNTLPPPGPQPRYVGRWSASAEGCSDPAWSFHARDVSTRGEVSCQFTDVTDISGGYRIDAMCTAEAPPAPYQMQITFAESARAMMIAGGPWQAPTSLVYCGPLPAP